MTAATALSLPTPWENSQSSPTSRRNNPSITTPTSIRPSRTPAAVMAPRATPGGRAPQKAPSARAPSPNYFGLVPDPSHDPANSSHHLGVNQHWGGQSPAVRSVAAVSPKVIPIDPRSSFEAFRRQSEGKMATVGQGGDVRMTGGEVPFVSSNVALVPAISREDRMDVDPAEPRRPPVFQRSSQVAVPSILQEIPQNESPETYPSKESPTLSRPSLSHFQERHSRYSLPGDEAHPPSAMKPETVSSQRASTLPTSMSADGPTLVGTSDLAGLLESSAEELVLLDVRVAPQFSQSRISGSLNLCIPTTLLKRPSFNVQKLAETFTKLEDRKKFDTWKTSKILVVYDDRSWTIKDAILCVSTLKKFLNEAWEGKAYVLKGVSKYLSHRHHDSAD